MEEKSMINNVNNTSPFINMGDRFLSNKPISSEPVEVKINEDAQAYFEFLQKDIVEISPQSVGEFVRSDLLFSDKFSNEAVNFLSKIQYSLGYNQFSGVENLISNEETVAWLIENDEVGKIGSKLLGGFEPNEANLNEIVNRFAQMKQDFEANYTGEDLETKLRQLDKAFEFVANEIGHRAAEMAQFRLDGENVRMKLHNAFINEGQSSNLYSGGLIKFDEEKTNDLISKIIEGVREATVYYANLTKQFVEENGQIKDDNSIKLLNAFLENAEREEGKFTYNDLNTIKDIGSQLMVQNRSETTFSQILKTFEFLN